MSDLPSAATRSLEHRFGESSPFSLGIEEEFQLVDSTTFELVPRVDDVLGHATDGERLHIKEELMQSVVEVATPVCGDVGHARSELTALRARVAELAHESECRIASAGTHPFARYDLQQVTDRRRYHDIMQRMQWIAQRELIFGLHVHVGVGSPEAAAYVHTHIRRYLPELLALSANSPYWQGRDTGLASSRSTVFDGFPRSGIPPAFESWDEWEALVRRSMAAGAIDDYTYIWWDVRPHPKFGTVEVRVCDAQTSIDDSLAIAAIIQALVAHLSAAHERGEERAVPPDFLIGENKWSAARYGLEGDFIDLDSDERISTREAVRKLVAEIAPAAQRLGSAHELAHVERMLVESGADRQRDWFFAGDTLGYVGERLADLTEGRAG